MVKYLKLRRGEAVHVFLRSKLNRTWTVCGKSRITHTLREIPERVVSDNIAQMCKLCFLGMTKKAFEAFEKETLVYAIEHSPELQRRFLEEAQEKIGIILEEDAE